MELQSLPCERTTLLLLRVPCDLSSALSLGARSLSFPKVSIAPRLKTLGFLKVSTAPKLKTLGFRKVFGAPKEKNKGFS